MVGAEEWGNGESREAGCMIGDADNDIEIGTLVIYKESADSLTLG